MQRIGVQFRRGVARVSTVMAIALTAAAVAGCQHAQLTDVWRDPTFEGGPFRSLLVVSQRSDDVGRRLWEDALSEEIATRGITATPSYQDHPDGPPSRSQVAQLLRSGGVEAALIVRPLPDAREAHFVPGWTSYEARNWYDPWRDRPYTIVRPRRHPGYTVVDRIARAQVTLWVAGEPPRMIWAASAENPSSGDALRKDIAAGLIPAFVKAGLLPRGGSPRASGT